MKILVTGGLGFIGSHTVVELQNEGFEVVAIDNLSNSSIEVLDGIEKITGKKPIFEKIDLREKSAVQNFFKKHQDIIGVIHFAASKAVGESVENPLLYYENNINSLVYVLQELANLPQANFIFSSSCTVYGQAEKMPITEDASVQPANSPYGNTKQIGEEIINDVAKVTNINAVLLRYFNPIGAHSSAEIGELPIGVPQNLVPYITQTGIGIRQELSVNGNDYPTPDGTCIRDYIHVVDLAKSHVVALQRLLNKQNLEKVETFNLGTGKGSSVLEVINAFEKVSGQKIPYKIVGRREGDVISAYANIDKANKDQPLLETYYRMVAIRKDENFTDEEKFDEIFALAKQLPRIDYCDPDTSYEEDMDAYLKAFKEYLKYDLELNVKE
jgi:UDP-glucose 4-epimerase